MKSFKLLLSLLTLNLVCNAGAALIKGKSPQKKTCVVKASGTNTTDDAPAILKAFEKCGHGGMIEFQNTTYYVNSVMNTTGLRDCTIDLKGTLIVCQNILLMSSSPLLNNYP
jgi:hypothetical protein